MTREQKDAPKEKRKGRQGKRQVDARPALEGAGLSRFT